MKQSNEVKINDAGKFFAPCYGDQNDDPLEKIGWGRTFDNRNLTKCNLKIYPLAFKKEFKLKIHPKYLRDIGAICECVDANVYLSTRTESHFTDDTFFTGELIKAILSVFARKDINYDQKCVLVAMKFHDNLKDFAATNENMLGECGGNTLKILRGNKKGGPTNQSNRNGCAMRIPLVGIFANSLSELRKIVLASIRNTHYHEHSFDAAYSVANIVFLARAGLSQKSMAKFINLEFKNKYTKIFEKYDNEQNEANIKRQNENIQTGKNLNQPNGKIQNKQVDDQTNRESLHYSNESHFFNFDMDNCTLQSVYNDRLKYKYAETALDTVVVALRIISVAGSFYEACVLAKAYGGDSDTLLAIVCAMAGVVFGVPQNIQEGTKKQLQNCTSQELKSYAKLSEDMDKQFSNCYPENISLEQQLKQTYNTIVEVIKNETRDIETINKNIGFNAKVDQIIYSCDSPSEFFWDKKPKTILFCFIVIPIALVGVAFYFWSAELALVALLTICILDFIAFRVIAKNFFSKRGNLALQNISLNAQKSQSKISIDNILNIDNIGNDITKSNEFKELIKSIIEDWNFNLNPDTTYNLNQRKKFEYEADGKQPEFKKGDYEHYLNTLKKYATSREAELKGLKEQLKTETNSTKRSKIEENINKIKGIIPEIQRQINEFNNSSSKQIHENYINEEKTLYEKISAHNKATAEFKTQKKLEKLKKLAKEEITEINEYVNKINEIAEKCGIEDKINFNKDEFSKLQKNQTVEIPDLQLKGEIITTNI